MDFAVEALEFQHVCQRLTKGGKSEADCKGVVSQKDKRERNLGLRCNTRKQFCILFVQRWGAKGVAVGEVFSFDFYSPESSQTFFVKS